MPLYEYRCKSEHPQMGCGYEFEEVLSVEERMEPMERPCPKCQKEDTIVRTPQIVNACGLRGNLPLNARSKIDPGVRGELERLKSENPSMITKIMD
jgi:hypothetical protein